MPSVCQLRMDAFSDLLDHFAVKGGQIIGLATGDESIIHDDFLVHPVTASMAHVGPNSWPGSAIFGHGQLRPRSIARTMANGGDRLPCLRKTSDEVHTVSLSRKVSGF